MRKIICLIYLLILSIPLFSQDKEPEIFFTLNGNLYIPMNNPDKGMYPILSYDKETDSKILIGGLGLGVSYFHPINSNLSLKGLTNFNKNTYWDAPVNIKDFVGNSYPEFLAGSSDFSLVLGAMAHYYVTEKISLGTGLSGQILLISLSRTPTIGNSEASYVTKKFYRPFIPMVPLEVSMKLKSTLISIRYEHGLVNRYKGDLRNFKQDKHGVLFFEFGFNI